MEATVGAALANLLAALPLGGPPTSLDPYTWIDLLRAHQPALANLLASRAASPLQAASDEAALGHLPALLAPGDARRCCLALCTVELLQQCGVWGRSGGLRESKRESS